MDAFYWDGTKSVDHADVDNWSDTDGGSTPALRVPGANDHAYFGNANPNACTLSDSWVVGSLTMNVGYAGKLDLATHNLTISDGGDLILNVGGEFDAGTGKISITNGTFDNENVTTWTRGTAEVEFNGTCVLTGSTTNDLYDLTCAANAVITSDNTIEIQGTVIVNGTISVNGSTTFHSNGSGTVLGASGRITGAGVYNLETPTSGQGLLSFAIGGVIDVAVFQVNQPAVGAILAPGIFSSASVLIRNVNAVAAILTLSDTSITPYVFEGNFSITNTNVGGTLTIDNATNDPNITFQGDVTRTETVPGSTIWTKGDGTLTLTGAANQDVDFAESDIEELTVNKSTGTVTFSGGWTADEFEHINGIIDPNGETFETIGDFRILAGAEIVSGNDAWNSVGITVGGNFLAVGTPASKLNLRGTAGWTLDVTGNALAFDVDASYSDALSGGGSAIVATRSTDSGNNQNWVFASGGLGADDATPLLFGLGMQMGNSIG